MRVDLRAGIRRVLEALNNNLTVQENFGPSGAPEDYILTSVGERKIPQWKPLSDLPKGEVVTPVPIKGDPGPPGPPGPPGTAVDVLAQFDKIVTADFGGGDWEVVVDESTGNVVYQEV